MRSRAACNAPDNSALVDMEAEGLVEGQRQMDLGARQAISDAERTARRDADRQFRDCAENNALGLERPCEPPPESYTASYTVRSERARQAGVWYVAAAQAAAAGQREASGAYVQAACYAKCSSSGEY
jgi:hypothetical protein